MARLYIKTPWSYETDFWFDVTSVNFNSKKVHEDNIFVRQDILQFLSQGSKYYKYIKSLTLKWSRQYFWKGKLNFPGAASASYNAILVMCSKEFSMLYLITSSLL